MTSHDVHSHSGQDDGQIHPHIVSPGLLLGVFGILLVLTVLTVTVTHVDLGQYSIWVAIGIAVVKASLVVLYFMHLRWDKPFNAIVFVSALIFVGIFLATTITDSGEYKVTYNPPANNLAQ